VLRTRRMKEMHFRKEKQYGSCMPFLTEEVYNVKPEERDTIGTNPSTRLFIVVVQGGAGKSERKF
jgi:hypothetical protein